MTPFMNGVDPGDLGLPSKFTKFRDAQLQMIDRSMNSTKRFVAHACPTGGGKSAAVVAEALYTGNRTVVLTSTKGLQVQYEDDFSPCGLVSVKGKANFTCCKSTGSQILTCEEGGSMGCKHVRSKPCGCPYQRQYSTAIGSPLVTTNYAYWCLVHRFSKGLGPVDTLVLDEAHNAPTQVSEQVNTPLSEREVQGMLRDDWPKDPGSIPQWRQWAQTHEPVAVIIRDKLIAECQNSGSREQVKAAFAWRSLAAKLHNIATMVGPWVVEHRLVRGKRDGYRLQAVWPYTYTEKLLFLGIKKIILISATINRKTLELLGVKRSECDFYEYPAVFEPTRSPVYFLPTVALNHKTGPEEFSLVVGRVDEIIGDRLDRKGIIHTTSYQRAVDIMNQSAHRDIMVLNESDNTIDTVAAFKTLPAPAVLVSPSVTTGYDFPLDQCEYQIVVKAPYPDLRSAVQNRRREEDWQYPTYEMAQSLVQACGRGTRTSADACENFLIDDTIHKAYSRSSQLFPRWFKEQIVKIDSAPPPPPPLADDDRITTQDLADADQCATTGPDTEAVEDLDWLLDEAER